MQTILNQLVRATKFCGWCRKNHNHNNTDCEYHNRRGTMFLPALMGRSFDEEQDSQTLRESHLDLSVDENILKLVDGTDFLYCDRLDKLSLDVDFSRDLVIPSDETEILRLLDGFADLIFPECKFSSEDSIIGSLRGRAITAIAKFDFYLLEKRIDIVPLCKVVGLSYYLRLCTATQN